LGETFKPIKRVVSVVIKKVHLGCENYEKSGEKGSCIIDFKIAILLCLTWYHGSFGVGFYSILTNGRLGGVLQETL
jgi:hypothetical protein